MGQLAQSILNKLEVKSEGTDGSVSGSVISSGGKRIMDKTQRREEA